MGSSDLVHELGGYTSGVWEVSAWQYIPTGFAGQSYFILMNSYDDTGSTLNWSTQIQFNSSTGSVINDGSSNGTLPIVFDQWVELRTAIDLTADTQSFFYGGQLLYSANWTDEVSGGGALNIAAIDLFSAGATSVYYDDISIQGVPEPATTAILGLGLLGAGVARRRKLTA
jgi:hypothetical protein